MDSEPPQQAEVVSHQPDCETDMMELESDNKLLQELAEAFPESVTESSISSSDASNISTEFSARNDETGTRHSNSTTCLQPALRTILASISDTLLAFFSKAPPHTIQRLAELILFPRNHYRTLPSYLHALDRVVHVTSTVSAFPLLSPALSTNPSKVLSSGSTVPSKDQISTSWSSSISTLRPSTPELELDESMGGALLIPIPWLKNSCSRSPLDNEIITKRSTEIIEGPNGPGGVETVSVSINGVSSAGLNSCVRMDDGFSSLRAEGGIGQGELLRQEQEAGVIPAYQLQEHDERFGPDGRKLLARSLLDIGIEDTGPQWETRTAAAPQNTNTKSVTEAKSTLDRDIFTIDQSNERPSTDDHCEDPLTPPSKRPAATTLTSGTIKRQKNDENPTSPTAREQSKQLQLTTPVDNESPKDDSVQCLTSSNGDTQIPS
ncbi:hypothetical protein BGHDH14_bgh01668 [Blumeria hordei DH14]|uniref:Uncharacterized protein n=1 Tax=Blumeria graminis f. sp. hordei (strain DH14) TaxID=546991 RepID=N1JIR9_BLUG1|nr:hypothetical protein BGHDH14_bgh01668 [Blumeria hordei DH14]